MTEVLELLGEVLVVRGKDGFQRILAERDAAPLDALQVDPVSMGSSHGSNKAIAVPKWHCGFC